MGKYVASVDDYLILPARVRATPGREHMVALSGGIVPAPVSIRFLIDTGAKRTTLIPGIIRHLQPFVEGEARLVTRYTERMTELVWVSLEFPEAGFAPLTEVLVARMAMPPALAQFHGLFGRDLLGRMHSFDYHGSRGRYVLRDTPGWFDWLLGSR
jgi:hypothetical protein